MQHPIRQPIKQSFIPFALLVGITPTPLNTSWQQANLSALIDSIIISVPTAAANVIFWGDASVNAALNNGLEIKPGVPINISINNERQLYEIQAPLIDTTCPAVPESIPFVCWDPSTIYLTAIAPTSIGVILFPRPYL